jgi:periplasmic divalent cation tolerance protein
VIGGANIKGPAGPFRFFVGTGAAGMNGASLCLSIDRTRGGNPMAEVLVVLTNCPDSTSADAIAGRLVENRLAACVNRLAPVTSTYRWEGAIETATEIPLLIKCTRARYAEVESAIRELHPYEVPEIVVLPVSGGWGPYLRWVDNETQPPQLA